MMVFCNLNDPLYYIASADLMERNIDQRIEVGTPIYDVEIQKELDLIFNYQWMGSVKSRLITSDMRNEYRKTEGAPFHAQLNLYLRYKNEVKD
jgi:polyphosphate kinase